MVVNPYFLSSSSDKMYCLQQRWQQLFYQNCVSSNNIFVEAMVANPYFLSSSNDIIYVPQQR